MSGYLRGSLASTVLFTLLGCSAAVAPERPGLTSSDFKAPETTVVLPSLFLEDLTWMEVRAAIDAGVTTILIPTGGTEQNGPHMVLGKHNIIVRYAAGEIAKRLGNTLVAPVIAYVPEGSVDSLTGHMWAPGTITLPSQYFTKIVEYAARGFEKHGFLHIIFIADSGGQIPALRALANTLNEEWASSRSKVLFASEWRRPEPFVAWLLSQGEKNKDIGTHAGILDTSLLLAIYPAGIRTDKLARGTGTRETGVSGDPRRARPEYGRYGLEMFITRTADQIRTFRGTSSEQN